MRAPDLGSVTPRWVAHPRTAVLAAAGVVVLLAAGALTAGGAALGRDLGTAGFRLGLVGYVLLLVGVAGYVAVTLLDRRRRG